MADVIVGMSGGVDSSVVAALLLEQGYEPLGATLVLPGTRQADLDDAERVCRRIGIPHEAIDVVDRFEQRVIEPFAYAYASGQTPNPCVHCNAVLKFPALAECADRHGAEHIATGHYAILGHSETTGRHTLSAASDVSKDQSYVLYGLSQELLARLILPLGTMSKRHVREVAADWGLGVEARPDSEDICFIPGGDYASYLEAHSGVVGAPGEIVDLEGACVGHHDGLQRYTIGQRKGISAHVSSPSQKPLYVVAKDVDANKLVVAPKDCAGASGCTAGQMNWVSMPFPRRDMDVSVKTRYRQRAVGARIHPHDGMVDVAFGSPQLGVAPGQSCVFYDGPTVLGGGIISEAIL